MSIEDSKLLALKSESLYLIPMMKWRMDNYSLYLAHLQLTIVIFKVFLFHKWFYFIIFFSFYVALLFIYLFFYLLLYSIVSVLPYINMNPPWVYTCSPSWTPLPPPSPYHPSGSCQCTSPKHPVSCIEPGLATHFIHDIIHVSMPFSQIFPPSPSPTESIRLFYTSVNGPKN